MKHNEDLYQVPSSMRIYTFEITVKEIKDKVQIVDAIFIEQGTSNETHCMSKEYKAIDAENIIEKDLEFGTSGALFFEEVSSVDIAPKGTLLIKFSNSDEWVKIDAE
ncbi:MAG: hypothetical protein HUJ84_05180 [Veillonella sp.]|nr:hypothetical protein [Veillonella sp.]